MQDEQSASEAAKRNHKKATPRLKSRAIEASALENETSTNERILP